MSIVPVKVDVTAKTYTGEPLEAVQSALDKLGFRHVIPTRRQRLWRWLTQPYLSVLGYFFNLTLYVVLLHLSGVLR